MDPGVLQLRSDALHPELAQPSPDGGLLVLELPDERRAGCGPGTEGRRGGWTLRHALLRKQDIQGTLTSLLGCVRCTGSVHRARQARGSQGCRLLRGGL